MDATRINAVTTGIPVRHAFPPSSPGAVSGLEKEKSAPVRSESAEVAAPATEPTRQAPSKREIPVGGHSIRFEIDKDIDRVVVKVIDKATGEVIREIPEEAIREVAKSLRESAGRLLDEMV